MPNDNISSQKPRSAVCPSSSALCFTRIQCNACLIAKSFVLLLTALLCHMMLKPAERMQILKIILEDFAKKYPVILLRNCIVVGYVILPGGTRSPGVGDRGFYAQRIQIMKCTGRCVAVSEPNSPTLVATKYRKCGGSAEARQLIYDVIRWECRPYWTMQPPPLGYLLKIRALCASDLPIYR